MKLRQAVPRALRALALATGLITVAYLFGGSAALSLRGAAVFLITIGVVTLGLLLMFGSLRADEANERRRNPHKEAHIGAAKGEPPAPFYLPEPLVWYKSPTTSATDNLFRLLRRVSGRRHRP